MRVEIKTKLINIHTLVQKHTVKNKNSVALRVIFVAAVKQNAFDVYLHTDTMLLASRRRFAHLHYTSTSF